MPPLDPRTSYSGSAGAAAHGVAPDAVAEKWGDRLLPGFASNPRWLSGSRRSAHGLVLDPASHGGRRAISVRGEGRRAPHSCSGAASNTVRHEGCVSAACGGSMPPGAAGPPRAERGQAGPPFRQRTRQQCGQTQRMRQRRRRGGDVRQGGRPTSGRGGRCLRGRQSHFGPRGADRPPFSCDGPASNSIRREGCVSTACGVSMSTGAAGPLPAEGVRAPGGGRLTSGRGAGQAPPPFPAAVPPAAQSDAKDASAPSAGVRCPRGRPPPGSKRSEWGPGHWSGVCSTGAVA